MALRSRDPKDRLAIDYNFLATARDRSRMLEGVKLSRAIAATGPMADVLAAVLAPGDDVRDDVTSMEVVDRDLASSQHPTSTAPMGGDDDEWAVVDLAGLVRGVRNLRVVDASILPQVPSTPTNLTTIMVAERIARRHLL